MARVTVEDCIDKVENRFDLVLLASHRARMISSGAQITISQPAERTRNHARLNQMRMLISHSLPIRAIASGHSGWSA